MPRTSQFASRRSFQSSSSQWKNEQELTDYFIDQLILNYPILVRGVTHTVGESELSQNVADQLIDAYPMFVRGVVKSVIEGDVEEMEDEIEETRSRRESEPRRGSLRRKPGMTGNA